MVSVVGADPFNVERSDEWPVLRHLGLETPNVIDRKPLVAGIADEEAVALVEDRNAVHKTWALLS